MRISFDDTSSLHTLLYNLYISNDNVKVRNQTTQLYSQSTQMDIDKLASCCESLLGFGISFVFSVLENPNIWQSDFEPLGELEQKQVG